MIRLARKYTKIIKRQRLVIGIPNAMVPALCDMMECRHDSPRAVVMRILKRAVDTHTRKKASEASAKKESKKRAGDLPVSV